MRTKWTIVLTSLFIVMVVAGVAFAFTMSGAQAPTTAAGGCPNGCCPGPCCIDPSLCPFGCCPCPACDACGSGSSGACCSSSR